MDELQADLVVKRHHTITLAEVTYMEEQIDAWTEELPEMYLHNPRQLSSLYS